MNWEKYFCNLIAVIASKSEDPTTKHGCIIVGPGHEIRSTGYNGLPRKVKNIASRFKRPEKYLWIEHSERNAIYNSARNGVNIEGCTLYVTGWPCTDCARGIIQSGIKEVVVHNLNKESEKERWAENIKRSKRMFKEAGVLFRETKEVPCQKTT